MSDVPDVFNFIPHPMTCGRCGAEVSSSLCSACGHDEKSVSVQLVECQQRLAAAETRCDELAETNANNIANYQMQLEDIDKERGDKYLSAECRTHGCQVHRLMAEVERMKRAPWVENRDLTQRLAAAEAREKSTYEQACYYRKLYAPQCESLDDTSGVLSQIDNFIAGLTQRLASAEALLREAVEKCRTIRPDGSVRFYGDDLSCDWFERAQAAGGE